MAESLWRLQVKMKGKKRIGRTAKKNLDELSNYIPNSSKESIENIIIKNTEDFAILIKNYPDINYEKAFLKVVNLSEEKIIKLFEEMFKAWSHYNLEKLSKIIGIVPLIKIMTFVKETYPNDYKNRVLKIWPKLDNYI